MPPILDHKTEIPVESIRPSGMTPKQGGIVESGHIRVLRSMEEIESVRDIWCRYQSHPNCDIDYYSRVVTSRSSILRPHVLVLYRGERAEAMLVGRLETGSVNLGLGYKTFLRFRARNLTFLHGGFMGEKSAGNCDLMLESIVQSLASDEADVAFFNHLPTDEALFGELHRLEGPSRLKLFTPLTNHRGVGLAASGEEFLKSLISKERKNQNRRSKRIQESFGEQVRICCYRSPCDIERMIQDIDEIAKKTYQRTLGVGFENTPAIRQRLELQAEQGGLRAYVLYLADRPCAFWTGRVYGATFYFGFTGYDSAYSAYSPGMFLLLKVFEQLCSENSDRRLQSADFGLGDGQWKLVLGDQSWREGVVFLFAHTLRGQLFSVVLHTAEVLNWFAKNALKCFHLVARVKKMWRRRLICSGGEETLARR